MHDGLRDQVRPCATPSMRGHGTDGVSADALRAKREGGPRRACTDQVGRGLTFLIVSCRNAGRKQHSRARVKAIRRAGERVFGRLAAVLRDVLDESGARPPTVLPGDSESPTTLRSRLCAGSLWPARTEYVRDSRV
jgi:hypothetical protein